MCFNQRYTDAQSSTDSARGSTFDAAARGRQDNKATAAAEVGPEVRILDNRGKCLEIRDYGVHSPDLNILELS